MSLPPMKESESRQMPAESDKFTVIKMLHKKMKQSSVPLSTGHAFSKESTAASGRTSDLQTIIDNFTQNSGKVAASKGHKHSTMKHKLRYNVEHVKNKQSSIPFAKFRQPNYIVYNRYGTMSAAQAL